MTILNDTTVPRRDGSNDPAPVAYLAQLNEA